MKQNDQPIVAFDRVTKKFRRLRAVDDVSFSVASGEVLGLIGDEESGKTTAISLLMGFSRPSKGEVRVNGRKVTPVVAHALHQHTGYAAYDTALPRSLAVGAYLRQVARRRDASDEQLAALVRDFRLNLSAKIGTLSLDEQQKVGLASVFLGTPVCIVLDEPMRGMDLLTRDVVLEAARRAAQQGSAVVISSQYPDDISRVCSRLLLLKDGRVANDLSRHDISRHSGKNVTLYAATEVELPPHARRLRTGGQQKLQFSYTGSTQALLEWLQGLKGEGVEDIEIESRSLNDEFKHLYEDSEGNDE